MLGGEGRHRLNRDSLCDLPERFIHGDGASARFFTWVLGGFGNCDEAGSVDAISGLWGNFVIRLLRFVIDDHFDDRGDLTSSAFGDQKGPQ